jgi:hypothetical protein
MMIKNRRPMAALLILTMTLGGCATAGGDDQPRTALDRSVGKCVASVAVGALLGALIGAASRNAGRGAAIGAGAGAVACAVIIAANNAEDRERIRQSRLAALKSGKDDTSQYTGKDGDTRMIRTSVQSVPMPANAPASSDIVGPCRRSQTHITIQNKGTAELDPETVCRTSAGDWVPLQPQKTV